MSSLHCRVCHSRRIGNRQRNSQLRLDCLASRAYVKHPYQNDQRDCCGTSCHAHQTLEQFTVGDASGSLPIGIIASGVLGVGLFVFGLRTFCYSQLTYVTASMLANSLPKTDLRIVQIGGGIKELYYYPSTTVQVTVMDEDAKEGLLQEASVQAGVPVVCRKESINALGRMVKSSADAIVLLSTLQDVKDMSAFLKDCHAVLKPGGRLIFVQAVKDGESASPVQSLVGSAGQALDINRLSPLKGNALFRDVQWDFANENIDPHIVGLAVAAE